MLNTFKIGGNTTSVSFASPSTGIIQKSHPKSRFVRCHKASKLADWLFDKEPHVRDKYQHGEWQKTADITVLQIMVYGDNELMVEIVENNFLTEENI